MGACLMMTVVFMFYGATCYLHYTKLKFDKGMPHWLGTGMIVISFVLTLPFMLSLAVPPVGPVDTYIHVASFCCGLFGYALLKAYTAVEYFVHVRGGGWKGYVY